MRGRHSRPYWVVLKPCGGRFYMTASADMAERMHAQCVDAFPGLHVKAFASLSDWHEYVRTIQPVP